MTFSDSYSEESIREEATALGKKSAEMSILEAQVFSAIRQELTEDQLTQLKQALSEEQKRPRGRHYFNDR